MQICAVCVQFVKMGNMEWSVKTAAQHTVKTFPVTSSHRMAPALVTSVSLAILVMVAIKVSLQILNNEVWWKLGTNVWLNYHIPSISFTHVQS